jgi:hypothetical protein
MLPHKPLILVDIIGLVKTVVQLFFMADLAAQ